MNDEARFSNFISILPEGKVDEIWNQLSRGEIDSRNLETLQKYWQYSQEILNEFTNDKTLLAYRRFNATFSKLNQIIKTDFFNEVNFRSTLQPEWKKDPGRRRWDDKLKELDLIADNFKENYINLIKVFLKKEADNTLTYDPNKRLIIYRGKESFVRGKKQYALMDYLAHKDGFCSYEELTKAVYDLDFPHKSDIDKLTVAIDKKAKADLKINGTIFLRSNGYRLVQEI